MRMANTAITLTSEDGVVISNLASVPVNSGDTVTFSSSGGAAFLFFSPAAAAVLSPSPVSPVDVSSQAAQFAFTSSDPAAYTVYFGQTADATHPAFPSVPMNLLVLGDIPITVAFGVINNNTRGR